MESWRAWTDVPISKCWGSTQKPPLDGRWVDANKGDDRNPDVRCRWVAQDFAVTKTDEFATRVFEAFSYQKGTKKKYENPAPNLPKGTKFVLGETRKKSMLGRLTRALSACFAVGRFVAAA